MKFVYAVMAHNAPRQLSALIDRLTQDAHEDRVVLHLDRRSDLWRDQRDGFAAHVSGRVSCVEAPAAVRWAHFSIVDAQRRLLAAALAHDFDYVHLISGADWPTRARALIERDIAAFAPVRPGFIDIFGAEQQDRMQDWWFDVRRLALPGYPRISANIAHAQRRAGQAFSACAKALGLQRSLYGTQPWIKGSGWWSLPRDIASALHDELESLLRSQRLRFTSCADEHAAPTILAARYGDRLAPGRRHIDWSTGESHPKLLTRADREDIIASEAWFARKFDMSRDAFFLDPEVFTANTADCGPSRAPAPSESD